jgi:hypothetical protein
MSELKPIDAFDELTAVIRFLLYIKRHPKCNITDIIEGTPAGQRAIYSAKKFSEKNQLLTITMKTTLPYGPMYTLSTKGEKLAEYLEAIQKSLES